MCCFVDMHLSSKKLSANAMLSSSIILEICPACFFCSNNIILSQSRLVSDDKTIVGIPEAMIAGELSNLIRNLSPVLFFTRSFYIEYISFAKS